MEYIDSFDATSFLNLFEPPMAHISSAVGHYILLIGGYGISYENAVRTITAFDKDDILLYDVISQQLSTLKVNYDFESILSFPTEFFFSSGMASSTYRNRIYLFGGYSLSKLEAGNALYYLEIFNNYKMNGNIIDVGKLSDSKITCKLVFLAGSYDGLAEIEHCKYPSYRDKASMVYWNEQLIVFGGYGCHFRAGESGENRAHDFLGIHGEYVLGSGNRGWTNQLLVYSIADKKWKNPETSGPVPCPRAAHSSAVSGNRMFVFGGRLGVRNTAETIRCNHLYYLDLTTLSWSQVHLDGHGLVGRSWTSFTPLSSHQFMVVGGFSGDNVPLSDAHIITLDDSCNNGFITTKTKCMDVAKWDPMMDCTYWQNTPPGDPLCRMWHSTSLAADGRIYIFGGCQNNLLFETERIQSTVERTLASPGSLYDICLWAVLTNRLVFRDDIIASSVISDIVNLAA